MKLEKLEIKGFRKCSEIEIYLGDATFLIGENNVGKSSILRAIEYLLTATKLTPASISYLVYYTDLRFGFKKNVPDGIGKPV